jgi:superfamily II DNA or RNA helicase/HKD family nuclease
MPRDRGVHEVLVTETIRKELSALGGRFEAVEEPLNPAEAADRLALHLSQLFVREFRDAKDASDLSKAVERVRLMADLLDAREDAPIEPATILRALLARLPDGSPEGIERPLIPLLDTTLLTNAPGEPRVGHQLLTEVQSADRIDLVMAFIRMSGVRPLLDALRRHCEAGRSLRVLTTTYTGSTEREALEALTSVGAKVRVSYETGSTRLHAKAWLFHRASGFSTAYIGSSNLTFSAQVTGLEWNVRVSGARNPDVIEKIAAVFESYYAGTDFVPYVAEEFSLATRSGGGREVLLSPIELRPEPFQERLLEQIELSRLRGHHRNLLVSATGTGKTVMAAVDYARLRRSLPRARLLFVAHREEILDQARDTFRYAIRDNAFGERWVGGERPERFEFVFASIQSLARASLQDLPPDHFDVVIVDEFHHAEASTYRRLLDHVLPRELLALTATPERADGQDVMHWFDGRIAAELRLWDAIDQHRLCPFAYYGIADSLDLRTVPFRRGRGYDVGQLTGLITADDAWARLVLHSVAKHVDSVSRMRALAFCVSVDHARFMARVFRENGVASTAVWADTPHYEREQALRDLNDGKINSLFSVDLFNEGVDLPDVDTLLFLRPTDSPTLFLQQLGRGLRRSHGKTYCTVLDFVGHHRKEFRYDRRFRALLGGSRRELERQISDGFPYLPAGCHMELDSVARERVLENIRQSIPSQWLARVAELRELGDVTLETYLEETGRDLEDVYRGGKTWTELREAAGLPVPPGGEHDRELLRACGRVLHVDDPERIDAWRRFASNELDPGTSNEREKRLVRMLLASVMDAVLEKEESIEDAAKRLRQHPRVLYELLSLVNPLSARIDHVLVQAPGSIALQVHARYTRIEMLSAFGEGKGARAKRWQSGAWHANASRGDLLAFTLDKTTGQFSPTTRYRDYAISRDLLHWESQSVTREASETGRRYQNHQAMDWSIHIFARLRQEDRAFWYLGTGRYISHEGERPMAIRWALDHALPGDLFARFAAAVA